MNKGVLGVCVLLSAVVAVVFAHESSQSIPAIFWSNTNVFDGKKTFNKQLPYDDLRNIISRSGSGFVAKNVNLESVVMFVDPELTPEELVTLVGARNVESAGVLSYLKEAVEKASSSLIFQYVQSSEPVDNIASLFDKVYVVKQAGAVAATQGIEVSFDALKTMTIFGNGETELIIVYLNREDMAAANSFVKAVTEVAQAGNYMAVFTSGAFNPEHFSTEYPSFAAKQAVTADATGDYAGGEYWPDGLVSGLIVMVPFMIILAIGLRCTFVIQSELKFGAGEKKKHQ